MRLAVELEPESAESVRILGEWRVLWGEAMSGGGIELAAADSLAALLDLKGRCFDVGFTVNALFTDNQ